MNTVGGPAAKAWAAVTGLVLLSTVLRFWRLGELALVGDESYYWLWSRHLDWAYFDHPAGVAVLTWLSTALAGTCRDGVPAAFCEAGVRWLNALLGVGSTLMAYLLGDRMLSPRAGFFAALLVAVGAPYLVTSRFVYTDALQLFLMLLNLYWFWRLVEERQSQRPLTAVLFGTSLALLFNTKYNAYLYACALLTAVLLEFRWMLRERLYWLSGLIAAAGLLPVVLWNATHNWVSFRWQLVHLSLEVTGHTSFLGNVRHSLGYLTWPLVLLALAGLTFGLRAVWSRKPPGRLLTLVALFLLVPLVFSPANSPRNLATGLVPLLLLAGAGWTPDLPGHWRTGAALLLAATVAATAVYGVGTVFSLNGFRGWPHSSVVPEIQRDAAGWRDLGPSLASYPEPVFALDYSIASQIWYYSGRPAFTAWGQYQIWGIPDLTAATIVSLDYLPEELVSDRLEAVYTDVQGPQRRWYDKEEISKEIRIWQVEGLRVNPEVFLEQFDFLGLLRASR